MGFDLFNLKGKIALVTGATHGLGMAMATGLAQAGATLVINSSSDKHLAEALNEYKKAGVEAKGYVFDVANEAEVMEAVGKIEREIGVIDILVNNAGIIKRVPLEDMAVADFKKVVDIDLVGPFIMSKHVVKGMIAKKSGKIINVCSMMSELGRSDVGAYAAAKGGLKMLTRNMACEWAKYNIQVNGIGPGYFATEQTAPIRVEGHPFNEFVIKRTPAERWGAPEDLVGSVVYLASRASDYVNGHILYVDGGFLIAVGKHDGEQ